ncbi:hypothetical protein EMCRGX_G023420 [Ephydatia muelleri]
MEDTAREDPAREDTAREDPAREDTAREDPAREDPAREDPAREDTARGMALCETNGSMDLQLQANLILSHATGVGSALPPERVRRLIALRINVHSKGYSGISLETVQQFVDALNASCLPRIPEKGSVGASGDLAPLAHLTLGLMGIGEMWSPESGWGNAEEILKAHNLTPLKLKSKEGLAAINGTQFITSLTAEALYRAELATKQADVIAALSIEALLGTDNAYDPRIHQQRCHPGQQQSAYVLRTLLKHDSEFRGPQLQDAYSLRCIPQVHGVTRDTLTFVHTIIETEMNSATDNPMIFSDDNEIVSGGNFHGEYPGKAADYLAIAVHEIANMSVMRIERLLNGAYSKGLPNFLVGSKEGLNSVSENKVLTHPSTVDSISTCGGTEDHVSMGAFAARKALQVAEHVEYVLAIEMIAACQAIDLRHPKKLSGPLKKVHDLVRTKIMHLEKDRFMGPDIDMAVRLIQEGQAVPVAISKAQIPQCEQAMRSDVSTRI